MTWRTVEERESGAAAEERTLEGVPPTVVALVEMDGSDAPVVHAARDLAAGHRATLVLLHVAPGVSGHGGAKWRRMRTAEAALQRGLDRWAARLRRRGFYVLTAVRFGEVVEQTAKAVVALGASAVVAASRPHRWLRWRSRDRRLRAMLDVPVSLVPGAGGEPDGCGGLARWPAAPGQPRSAA